MRVLRLDDDTTGPSSGSGIHIDLHPQLTVLTATSPLTRQRLIDAIAGIARGHPSIRGVIEVAGAHLELTADSLAGFGLDRDLDVVVRRDDLPGDLTGGVLTADGANDAGAGTTVGVSDPTDVRASDAKVFALADKGAGALASEGQPSTNQPDEDVDHLRADQEAAVVARDAAEGAVVEAQRRRQGAADALARGVTDLAAARSALGVAPEREQITGDETSLSPSVDRARANAEPAPVAAQIAQAEARRMDLQRRLVTLVPQDPISVQATLERIARAGQADPAPIPAALALADAWRDLHEQLTTIEQSETDGERRCRELLEEARRSAAEAEKEMRVPVVDPDRVADLEAAHAALLEAQDTSGALWKSRARSRLESARVAERALLDEFGFATYADYMMSSSSRGLTAAKRAILQAARTHLAEVESAWQSLEGGRSNEAWRADLADQRSAIAPRIAKLLGHEPAGPDVEEELRALRRVPAAGDGVLSDLRTVLADVGVELAGNHLDQEELVEAANTWLHQNGQVEARREMLEAEIGDIDDQLMSLRQTQEPGQVAPSSGLIADRAPTGGADPVDPVDPVDRAVAGEAILAARRAEDRVAAAALEQAEMDLVDASARVVHLQTALASGPTSVAGPGRSDPAFAPDELIEDIEWYLLARLAAQRSVGSAGSLPLVLDDTFHDVEVAAAVRLMEALERMSSAVQVILVSDDQALSFWAESLGGERASSVAVGK